MKLELIGHDEKYALEQSLLTLFPGEKPVYGTVDETSDTRWARVTLTEEDERVQVTTELGVDGKSAAHSYDYPLSGTEYEKEGQRRHAVGISFFGAAKDLLGISPAWGSLTGVRPSKVALSLIREGGKKRAEKELQELYCVTPARARLAIEAADAGIRAAAELGCEAVWIMDDDTLPEPDALAALLAADAAHGDGCGWLSSRALAPDGTDQPMNLQRITMYRDIVGFDAAEVPAVMASFVSLFLRTEAVRQFGLPIAEFFIWSDDWEYTRRISRAKPCYVIPASRVVHAMQNPGVVNIARDVPARWARYRYFYRNDVVLYRREGLSGWLWLLAKDSWHTVQVLRDGQGCRAERIKIIWKGFAAGVRFRPQIPYLP